MALTRTAMREAKGPMDTLELPIRFAGFSELGLSFIFQFKHETKVLLVDQVNKCRNEALTGLFSALDKLLDEFLHDRNSCTFECNAIHYGALTKELSTRGLLFPQPQTPFLGYSFSNVAASIRSIPDLQWCDLEGERRSYPYRDPHGCRLRSHLENINDRIENHLSGLSLADVLPEDTTHGHGDTTTN